MSLSSQGKTVISRQSVLILRLITAATAVADGYDVGVVNGVSMILANVYEPTTISFFVSIMPAFVGIGALIGAFAADRFGRKPVLIGSYLLLIIGPGVMAIPTHLAVLMTGRALVGLGIGIGGVVGTVYMAEIAPTKQRGSFVAQEALFLSCGLLLGYLSNYLLMSVKHNYNVMLGIGAILPAVCLTALLTIGRSLPESPHWTHMKKRDGDESGELLLSGDSTPTGPTTLDRNVIAEFLACPGAFSALLIGVLQPLCGIGPILYFSDLTFSTVETAGKPSGSFIESPPVIAMSSIYIGVTKVVMLMIATLLLMDRFGRRTLLLSSGVLITLSMVLIASTLTWMPEKSGILLLGFCCAVGSYAIGWNCVPAVYPSEVLPTRMRTFGLSFVTVVGRIISVGNAFLYPLLGLHNANIWFFVFSGMNVVSLCLVWSFAKETLHKPLMVGNGGSAKEDSDREEIIDHIDDEDGNNVRINAQ